MCDCAWGAGRGPSSPLATVSISLSLPSSAQSVQPRPRNLPSCRTMISAYGSRHTTRGTEGGSIDRRRLEPAGALSIPGSGGRLSGLFLPQAQPRVPFKYLGICTVLALADTNTLVDTMLPPFAPFRCCEVEQTAVRAAEVGGRLACVTLSSHATASPSLIESMDRARAQGR